MKESSLREFNRLMRPYCAKGSKANRKKQYQRALSAIEDMFQHEPLLHDRLEGLGRNHVTGFWRRNKDMNPTTKMNYWYALRTIFLLLGKSAPPKPKDLKLASKLNDEITDQEELEQLLALTLVETVKKRFVT